MTNAWTSLSTDFKGGLNLGAGKPFILPDLISEIPDLEDTSLTPTGLYALSKLGYGSYTGGFKEYLGTPSKSGLFTKNSDGQYCIFVLPKKVTKPLTYEERLYQHFLLGVISNFDSSGLEDAFDDLVYEFGQDEIINFAYNQPWVSKGLLAYIKTYFVNKRSCIAPIECTTNYERLSLRLER